MYPWSPECQGVAPIQPTAAENQGMWHGEGGYAYAKGKNIPAGSRCESVQLLPYEKLMHRHFTVSDMAEAAVPNGAEIFNQFPPPSLEGLDLNMIFPLLISKKTIKNSFI